MNPFLTAIQPMAWESEPACVSHMELFDDAAHCGPTYARSRRAALSICVSCPVRRECARNALDIPADGTFRAGVRIPQLMGPSRLTTIRAKLAEIAGIDLTA